MKKPLLLLLALNLRIVIFAADFAFEARGLPLADVGAAVGKHYGVSVFFSTPEMGNKLVTGNLHSTTEADALGVLGFLAGAPPRRVGDVIYYGGSVTAYDAFPAGVVTQEQAARIEGVSLIGGYAVVKGDEVTQRNLSSVFEKLTVRRPGRVRVLIADMIDTQADALQDLFDRAKITATWTGSIESSRFNLGLDFRAILDFLKQSTKNKILLDTEVSLLSGEEVEHNAGKVLERPLYIRANQSDQDLVTRYDRLQLGLVFKYTGFWDGNKWQLRYSLEDSDYITEQKKISFRGVEQLAEGEGRMLVKLRRTVDVTTKRGIPILSHITGRRAFTWKTNAGEERIITVFMEMLQPQETPPKAGADAQAAAPASAVSP